MSRQSVLSSGAPEAAPGGFGSLTWKGFAWAAVLPGLGVLLFCALVFHVRLTLGRWPHFNESLPTRALSFHDTCVDVVAFFLFVSLYVVPLLVILSLCFRRWRHIAVYVFAYAVFVALAWGSVLLAPHEFLNWFLD